MIDSQHLQFIQQLGRSYRAFVAGFEAHTGQSMARWRILVLLSREAEMSQKRLVKELAIDPAALTRQLKALERAGLVARQNDAQDARVTNVALTSAGRQAVESTMTLRNEYLDWALGDLPLPDIEVIMETLVNLEQRVTNRPAVPQRPSRSRAAATAKTSRKRS
ncbi:MAG TPA: MarR family transcriptional regulator [Burkholderiaceae bacterium]|nr:MarR family transcriptional regulator [Burkholderiaceae bacterium]